MTNLTLLQTLVPVIVPAAIAALKAFMPRLPKPWLPILAPLLGALLEILATRQFGAHTALGAVLGAAGVGLREIFDQLRKASGPPDDTGSSQATPRLALIFFCLALPFLAGPGCQNPDRTAYATLGGIEAAIDKAMRAWADYVQQQRNQGVDISRQEARVKQAYGAYRTAMNTAYQARLDYLNSRQTGLPAWQAAIGAAQNAAVIMLQLVDSLLPTPISRDKLVCSGGTCVVTNVPGCPGGHCLGH